ncbi:unnamed protein product [Paramecium sonneborni]|uniref:Uncharacterized protein n=1 Tax=Paramecium sonneborni TaxID=65129 RepID=A0A8S1KPY9_9CILI|nr:unnamed protein product [Paramecium sonneborni]
MQAQVQRQRNKSQNSKIQSILKCRNYHEKKKRKDRSGNDIIRGGNYKITFKDSFLGLKTNSFTPQNELDNYSESELSDYSESQQSQIQGQNQTPLANQTSEIKTQVRQTSCDLEIKIEMKQEFPKINSDKQSKNLTKATQKSLCCTIF